MPKLDEDHKPVLKEYLYQICALKGSGEYGINYMFNQIVFAINPVIKDLEFLKDKVDICFMYGTHDWMDLDFHGEPVSQTLKNMGVKVYMIEDSDHHLYIDNPDELFKMLVDHLEGQNQDDVNMEVKTFAP